MCKEDLVGACNGSCSSSNYNRDGIIDMFTWKGVHDSLNSVLGEMAKRANFNCVVYSSLSSLKTQNLLQGCCILVYFAFLFEIG